MSLSERINIYMSMDEAHAKRVVQYYTRMAEDGNAKAQYALGLLLRNGEGVAPDYGKGLYWLEKAALQGHAEAEALCREDLEPDTDAKYEAYV